MYVVRGHVKAGYRSLLLIVGNKRKCDCVLDLHLYGHLYYNVVDR